MTLPNRALSYVSLLLLLALSAIGQNNANWNTTSGNWNNANNWDCVIGGVSSHCVPNGAFVITNIGGDITLDTSPTILYLLGNGGSLTLSSRTLTATDPLGIQMTGGIVNLSAGSTINGYVLANNLQIQNSAINGSTQAFEANIAGGTLGSIMIANQLTASNSSFGSNSNLTLGATSSISNSTLGGTVLINGGALTVDNGSIINSTQTSVGTGSLTLQGGSTWNQTFSPVFLGISPGSSSLDVTGTGTVLNLANTALELGEIGNGSVTVEHSGSIVATGTGGNLLIGLGAVFPTNSQMTVNSGGTVSANKITVEGAANGSTATLSLSDSSSSITAADEVLVTAGGIINAANQSSFRANSLRIQTGSVTIDSGASLTLVSDTVALVASLGTGSLTLQGGGTASGPGELVVGGSAGASGTMVITDLGSAWHGTSNVSIGEAGSGSMSVLSGGLLETGADGDGLSGVLGNQATGAGTATIRGGDWQAGGTLQIGNAGSGTLNLQQAGTVESGAAVLGVNSGATGTVSVSDAGSKWTVSGDLTVGSGGTAFLTIANGGLVTNQDATIGELAGSSGTVSVTGAGSRWTNSGSLTVGSNGGGSLGISGAAVVTDVNATIGDKRGSNGVVTVTGLGSSWQNSGILTIGGDGAASLTIDAGSVMAGGASMGSNFSPVNVTVTNHGSLTVLGDVSIGGAAATTLTIENGATFDTNNATIGGSGGDTTVTVTGTDSAWTLHDTGALTLDDKGTLLVEDGGTLTANTITLLSGSLLNGQGGHIVGSIMNQGGTVTPGDATGVMTVTGNYTQTFGVLLFEIDGLGPTQFDQLVISGLANLSGGSLDVLFGNGFTPAAGESFDLISAALGLSLTNVNFDVIGLPSGLQFTDTIGSNGFTLNFAPSTQSAAPEPSAALLFVLGLVAVLASRARRLPAGHPLPPAIVGADLADAGERKVERHQVHVLGHRPLQ